MTKMGPNNVRHVIWALGESSFFFLFILFNTNNFFIVSIGYIYGIHRRKRAGMTRTTKTGQNDTSHVIWALGEFFFFFFSLYSNIFIGSKLQNSQQEEIGSPRCDVSQASGQPSSPTTFDMCKEQGRARE